MKQYFLDLRLSFLTGTYFTISFMDVDKIMKFIIFMLTAGYTIRRWYLLEKNRKDEN